MPNANNLSNGASRSWGWTSTSKDTEGVQWQNSSLDCEWNNWTDRNGVEHADSWIQSMEATLELNEANKVEVGTLFSMNVQSRTYRRVEQTSGKTVTMVD